MSEPSRIAVVGAGLAGLAAAERLARDGHRVTVFERAERAGGRALAFHGTRVAGLPHRVTTRDRRLLELVRRVGLESTHGPVRPVGRAQVQDGRMLWVEPAGLLGAAALPGVRLTQAARLLRLPRLERRFAGVLDPERPERAAGLDDRSVADFGRLYFGPSLVSRWMEPTLSERAPCHEARASRVAFLLQRAHEAWATVGTLRAPVVELVDALCARLEVRAGVAVERIESAAAGGLVLQLRSSAGVQRHAVDAVVLAAPAQEALRIAAAVLTAAERDVLAATRHAATIAWAFRTRTPLVRRVVRVRVPRAERTALAGLLLETGAPTDAVTSFLWMRDAWSRERLGASDDALAKELDAELGRLLPGARDAVTQAEVARFAHAWPELRVGDYRALARLARVGEDRRRAGRRLYLAGDYRVAPTLEGAVASGLRAAQEASADLPPAAARSAALSRPARPA